MQLLAKQEGDVTVQLACMPVNCRDMHANLMMGSGRLPEGGLEGVGPRMEAGEPLEGRSNGNNEVSMSHGHSGQVSDYLAGVIVHCAMHDSMAFLVHRMSGS